MIQYICIYQSQKYQQFYQHTPTQPSERCTGYMQPHGCEPIWASPLSVITQCKSKHWLFYTIFFHSPEASWFDPLDSTAARQILLSGGLQWVNRITLNYGYHSNSTFTSFWHKQTLHETKTPRKTQYWQKGSQVHWCFSTNRSSNNMNDYKL